MENEPLDQADFAKDTFGAGPVTREMVHVRMRELALLAGRLPAEVSQADYEQARRELTGESDPDRQDAALDPLPEARRPASVPGPIGSPLPESPTHNPFGGGGSELTPVADQGTIAAGRNHMLLAARAVEHHYWG